MVITTELARSIIDIVSRDRACVERISSTFGHLKLGGRVRNAAMVAAGMATAAVPISSYAKRQWDSEPNSLGHRWCCVGIAEATVAALDRAKPNGVASVYVVSRAKPFSHSATGIVLENQTCVFDWWCSLEVDNHLRQSGVDEEWPLHPDQRQRGSCEVFST